MSRRKKLEILAFFCHSSASFKSQKVKAAAKAKAKAGWILRVFTARDVPTMRVLWRSLVQPHQDYASQLWSPVSHLGELRAQEAPLRAFSKRVKGLRYLPYNQRLARMGLSSIERRQERYKILYTFKAMKGLVPPCGITIDELAGPRRGVVATIPPIRGT